MNFYAITGTQADDFSAEEQRHIDELTSKYQQYDDNQIAYVILNAILSGASDRPNKQKLSARLNGLLRRLANEGVAEYQTLLGDKLFNKLIAPDDGFSHASEAKIWYEKASDKQDARATYMLGLLYEGAYKGVSRDPELSAQYYQRAKDLHYDPMSD